PRVPRRLGARGAEHRETRHVQRVARHVAAEADEFALELQWTGARIGLLLERVEDDALRRVGYRDLQQIAAAHPSHRDAIVEEQSARVLLADAPALEAGAREDEELRIDRQVERREGGGQVAALLVEGELQLAVLQLLVDVDDGVARRRRRIFDGGIVGRPHERARPLARDRHGEADERKQADRRGEGNSKRHSLVVHPRWRWYSATSARRLSLVRTAVGSPGSVVSRNRSGSVSSSGVQPASRLNCCLAAMIRRAVSRSSVASTSQPVTSRSMSAASP